MNKLAGTYLAPLIIVPLILLVSGAALKRWPPENINSVYGFRTRESSESLTKWKEANRLMADLLLVGSLVLAVLNSAVFLCTAFASEAIAERAYRATPFWMIGSLAQSGPGVHETLQRQGERDPSTRQGAQSAMYSRYAHPCIGWTLCLDGAYADCWESRFWSIENHSREYDRRELVCTQLPMPRASLPTCRWYEREGGSSALQSVSGAESRFRPDYG